MPLESYRAIIFLHTERLDIIYLVIYPYKLFGSLCDAFTIVTGFWDDRLIGYKPGFTTVTLPNPKPEYEEYIYSTTYDNENDERILHCLLHPEQLYCLTTYKYQVAVYKLELALKPDSYPNLLGDLYINSRFTNRFFAEFYNNEYDSQTYQRIYNSLGFFIDPIRYAESELQFENFSVKESRLNIELVNRLFSTLFTKPENWERLSSVEAFDNIRRYDGSSRIIIDPLHQSYL